VSIARELRQVRGRQAVILWQEVVDLAVVPLGRDGFGEHERRGEGRDRAGGAVGREVLAVAAAGDGPVSATGLVQLGRFQGGVEGGWVRTCCVRICSWRLFGPRWWLGWGSMS
jgi:hypothetical protein